MKGFVYLCFIFVFMKFDYFFCRGLRCFWDKYLERIVFKAVEITLF